MFCEHLLTSRGLPSDSTCVLKAESGKFDIKRRLPGILLINIPIGLLTLQTGSQWLSGTVLDSIPMGRGFEPHRRHCVVSLSKNINPSLVLV